ncbi:dihydrofolate reductase family protein [Kitasatospora sp. NPDC096147]|uniref:dihydrofolate reductase family protein n=1 Tax=Kitasatospora sp. NPDC096147 TaxID=3364093 RepID=UPI00382FDF2E
MRSLTAGFFVSLDGVVEAPYTWHFPYLTDQVTEAVMAMTAKADAMLFGRHTYQEFASHWTTQPDDDPLAAHLNSLTKYVASSTLETADWQNSTLLGAEGLAERITGIKQQPGGDIAVSGSATLVRWLLANDLLDELTLLVHPVVLGTGARLFEGTLPRRALTLAHSAVLDNGTLHLTYRTTP